MVFAGSWARACWGSVVSVTLVGCVSLDTPPAQVVSMPAQGSLLFSPKDKAQWEAVALPGKLRTTFKLEKRGQRPVLQADAQSSASMLRQRVNVPADRLGRLQFEWQVENLLEGATPEAAAAVKAAARDAEAVLGRAGVRVRLDDSDLHTPAWRYAHWEQKGVPLRLEIGPRDVKAQSVMAANRLTGEKVGHSRL